MDPVGSVGECSGGSCACGGGSVDSRVITVEQIMQLYASGLIGFKEARSLLSVVLPAFVDIRDGDLDVGEDEVQE